MEPLEIGVCYWSLGELDPAKAFAIAREQLGVGLVQYGFIENKNMDVPAAAVLAAAKANNIALSAACVLFADCDYSSIASINATAGFGPDATWARRLAATRTAAKASRELGVKLLSIHIGQVPEGASNAEYVKLTERTARVADELAELGLDLGIESGQEPPETLRQFVEDLGRENVKVNLDPGNYVLYGTGEPVRAVSALRGWVVHTHMKDALPSDAPGEAWGEEVILGIGEADIPRVISKLRAGGYAGPLIIERENNLNRLAEIRDAVEYLSSMF